METLGLTDIIGPVMVGPSSSHTAGALRIASMARSLCLAEPVRVEFSLLGSFAHPLSGHGTAKARARAWSCDSATRPACSPTSPPASASAA
mgnify:CR=1 FL=1